MNTNQYIDNIYNNVNNEFLFRHAAFSTADPPYTMTSHLHDKYEIYMFCSGNASYSVEGNVYDLNPYDVIITNRRELHRLIFHEDCYYRRKTMLISPSFLSAFMSPNFNPFSAFESRKSGVQNKFDHTVVMKQGIDKLINKIEEISFIDVPERDVLIKSYLIQLLVKMAALRDKTASFNPNDTSINRILDFVNRNIQEDLTYEIISKKFYINRDYLYRFFKKNTGFSLGDYIRNKRIMKARELLMTGTKPTEIPSLIGYHDYSTFYRAFNKNVGISPTDYIKAFK
ncbi:MAG: AraC family transcriptional regulator [Clostridia bacterium]|nr:AraC family transcriptional regulator [Clostridia bacterium]